jgi:hypothetical protein
MYTGLKKLEILDEFKKKTAFENDSMEGHARDVGTVGIFTHADLSALDGVRAGATWSLGGFVKLLVVLWSSGLEIYARVSQMHARVASKKAREPSRPSFMPKAWERVLESEEGKAALLRRSEERALGVPSVARVL